MVARSAYYTYYYLPAYYKYTAPVYVYTAPTYAYIYAYYSYNTFSTLSSEYAGMLIIEGLYQSGYYRNIKIKAYDLTHWNGTYLIQGTSNLYFFNFYAMDYYYYIGKTTGNKMKLADYSFNNMADAYYSPFSFEVYAGYSLFTYTYAGKYKFPKFNYNNSVYYYNQYNTSYKRMEVTTKGDWTGTVYEGVYRVGLGYQMETDCFLNLRRPKVAYRTTSAKYYSYMSTPAYYKYTKAYYAYQAAIQYTSLYYYYTYV